MNAGTVGAKWRPAPWPALALVALVAFGCEGKTAPSQSGPSAYTNNCAPCHGADGAGVPIAKAPAIGGLPEWYLRNQVDGFRQGLRGTHYDDVQGMRMRPMAMTLAADEVAPVVAHVASLPRQSQAPTLTGGDAAKGAQYFTLCATCHGADAKGNETLNAPPLAGATDWYLLNQLTNFKAGIRGGNPKDTRGAQMRPMAATLPDEQAIKDVLAHVATLSR